MGKYFKQKIGVTKSQAGLCNWTTNEKNKVSSCALVTIFMGIRENIGR